MTPEEEEIIVLKAEVKKLGDELEAVRFDYDTQAKELETLKANADQMDKDMEEKRTIIDNLTGAVSVSCRGIDQIRDYLLKVKLKL